MRCLVRGQRYRPLAGTMKTIFGSIPLQGLLCVSLAHVGCGNATSRPDRELTGGSSGSRGGGLAGHGNSAAEGGASAAGGASANGGTPANGGVPAGGVSGANSTGGGEVSASGGVSGKGASEPSVSGTWAMFAFEDPVVVMLAQNGQTLTGRGCCAPGALDCCGNITQGSIVDRRARFTFPVLGTESYAADVRVSAAGDRMTGNFHGLGGGSLLSAWVRVANGETWLSSTNTELRDAVNARARRYVLSLESGEGDEFATDSQLEFNILGGHLPTLSGDLGAFWAGEMVWNEEETTLVVGPVPETVADLPVRLELRFNGVWLQSVLAVMPSERSYTFASRSL